MRRLGAVLALAMMGASPHHAPPPPNPAACLDSPTRHLCIVCCEAEFAGSSVPPGAIRKVCGSICVLNVPPPPSGSCPQR